MSQCHNGTLSLIGKGFNNLGEREKMDGGLALFLSYSVNEASHAQPISLGKNFEGEVYLTDLLASLPPFTAIYPNRNLNASANLSSPSFR